MRQPVGHYPGLKLWTALFFVFLYAPMVVLVAYSFNVNKLAMIWGGFSLKWYAKIFAGRRIGEAAMNSLFVAVIATSIAVVDRHRRGAGAGARSEVQGGWRFKCPDLHAAHRARNRDGGGDADVLRHAEELIGFDLGIGNIVIAHTVFCIPFAFMPIRARLQDMDMAVEYAARDLYASAWNAFRYVTLPLLMPGVIAGAMLAFVISLDDFIITQMISGPGTTTLPVYIYSMIRNGITPEVNAASTILIAVSTALVTVYWYVSRPKKA